MLALYRVEEQEDELARELVAYFDGELKQEGYIPSGGARNWMAEGILYPQQYMTLRSPYTFRQTTLGQDDFDAMLYIAVSHDWLRAWLVFPEYNDVYEYNLVDMYHESDEHSRHLAVEDIMDIGAIAVEPFDDFSPEDWDVSI